MRDYAQLRMSYYMSASDVVYIHMAFVVCFMTSIDTFIVCTVITNSNQRCL